MIKKKDFTITKAKFIEWAFESGYDDEQEDGLMLLGEMVLEQLKGGGKATVSVEELFEAKFELSAIGVQYTEQADEFVGDDEYAEIGDLVEEFTIKLID